MTAFSSGATIVSGSAASSVRTGFAFATLTFEVDPRFSASWEDDFDFWVTLPERARSLLKSDLERSAAEADLPPALLA